MPLNQPEVIPPSQSMEKSPSTKWISGAKKFGNHCQDSSLRFLKKDRGLGIPTLPVAINIVLKSIAALRRRDGCGKVELRNMHSI